MVCRAGVDLVGLHVIYRLGRQRRAILKAVVEDLCSFRYGTARNPCIPVLVTRSTGMRTIASWCVDLGIFTVQLHSSQARVEDVRRLRQYLADGGRECDVIKTVVLRSTSDIDEAMRFVDEVDCVLCDSSSRGGTGVLGRWDLVAELVARAPRLTVVVAGGIRPNEADRALLETGAAGVDVQTYTDLSRNRGTVGRAVPKKRKDVKSVIQLCATARGTSAVSLRRVYNHACVDTQRVVLAVADLAPEIARITLNIIENCPIDGIQIDGSDGQSVRAWPVSPREWAARCARSAPEVPIWLHLFSAEETYLTATVGEVVQENSHLVGVYVHCLVDDPSAWLAEVVRIRQELDSLAIVPTVDVGKVMSIGKRAVEAFVHRSLEFGFPSLSLTAPVGCTLREKVKRSSGAVHYIRRCMKRIEGLRIGLDRGVSASLVEAMGPDRPDYVIMGRHLAGDMIVSKSRRVLAALIS